MPHPCMLQYFAFVSFNCVMNEFNHPVKRNVKLMKVVNVSAREVMADCGNR